MIFINSSQDRKMIQLGLEFVVRFDFGLNLDSIMLEFYCSCCFTWEIISTKLQTHKRCSTKCLFQNFNQLWRRLKVEMEEREVRDKIDFFKKIKNYGNQLDNDIC